MTLRPGRPVIPVNRCMFDKCNSTRGTAVTPDGVHERVLCEKHAAQVRAALHEHGATVRVSWGRWTQEIVDKYEAELKPLLAEFGEPDWPPWPDASLTDWPPWPDASLDDWADSDADEAVDVAPTRQELGWGRIEDLRSLIHNARDRPSDEPVVRIALRTR